MGFTPLLGRRRGFHCLGQNPPPATTAFASAGSLAGPPASQLVRQGVLPETAACAKTRTVQELRNYLHS